MSHSSNGIRSGFLARVSWILPFWAFLFGGEFGDQHEMQGRSALFVLGVGFMAGALWQVFSRRDLADRLAFFVPVLAFGALFLFVSPSGFLMANSGPAHALAGTVAGLVVAEQVVRWRTYRILLASRRELQPATINS